MSCGVRTPRGRKLGAQSMSGYLDSDATGSFYEYVEDNSDVNWFKRLHLYPVALGLAGGANVE